MKHMKHDMILSPSGWRKVFASSGDEKDTFPDIGEKNRIIAALAADTFADYILAKRQNPAIILGIDTRPTGPQIADTMLRVFMARRIAVSYAGIIAAPEIMAYAHTADAFVYISASHNPIGHNGIKFGLNDGGVLSAEENASLIRAFEAKCEENNAGERITEVMSKCSEIDLEWVFAESVAVMREATSIYRSFAKTTISGTDILPKQNKFFALVRAFVSENPLGVVCDMNGSARTLSIDSSFLREIGMNFMAINNRPGQIAHEIIPEPENLVYVASEMERLQAEGRKDIKIGYMPDCDGDRGNFVVWNGRTNKAEVLKAQDVFALSVLSEIAYTIYMNESLPDRPSSGGALQPNTNGGTETKIAVAANCPTSMRIDDIAAAFGASVFRAEVGEANVVNLAREKRNEGYTVRILGEGSNGGNITHPAAVRDPLNTLFALLKLIFIQDSERGDGLFHLWCKASGQMDKYESCKNDFTLIDVLDTIPKYATTGVSEKRAILKIKSEDQATLKKRFQEVFEAQWDAQKDILKKKYGFESYEAVATNGTDEKRGIGDFSESGRGGLKILLKGGDGKPLAFIWMRGSGTEPVFRVMADVSSAVPDYIQAERKLLEWETKMLLKADAI